MILYSNSCILNIRIMCQGLECQSYWCTMHTCRQLVSVVCFLNLLFCWKGKKKKERGTGCLTTNDSNSTANHAFSQSNVQVYALHVPTSPWYLLYHARYRVILFYRRRDSWKYLRAFASKLAIKLSLMTRAGVFDVKRNAISWISGKGPGHAHTRTLLFP